MINLLFLIIGLLAGRLVVHKYPKLDALIGELLTQLKCLAIDAYRSLYKLFKKKEKHDKKNIS